MKARQPLRRTNHRAPTAEVVEVTAALDAFRRIVQALRIGARKGEQRTGLSSAQLFALQQLARNPGVSINDLAALTLTHQSSVSVVIQRLVEQRLVVKVAARADRRRLQLQLTAAGARAVRGAPTVTQERLIAAITALSATDRRALARALGAVAQQLSSAGGPAHPAMLFEDGARQDREVAGKRKRA